MSSDPLINKQKNDIKLPIEPINTIDIPGFYLTTVSQAKKIMEAVNSSNLFLQYDIYQSAQLPLAFLFCILDKEGFPMPFY